MAEPAELIPTCIECGAVWLPESTERWRACWIHDGPEEVLLFYCEACSEREFGSGTTR
jgi:hypothetical protein